jgi:hypothetical protein
MQHWQTSLSGYDAVIVSGINDDPLPEYFAKEILCDI